MPPAPSVSGAIEREKRMRYGLIGWPLGHSISPQLHRRLAGVNYELHPLPEEQFDRFMREKDFAAVKCPSSWIKIRKLNRMIADVEECFRKIIENRNSPKAEPMVDGKSGFLYFDKNESILLLKYGKIRNESKSIAIFDGTLRDQRNAEYIYACKS